MSIHARACEYPGCGALATESFIPSNILAWSAAKPAPGGEGGEARPDVAMTLAEQVTSLTAERDAAAQEVEALEDVITSLMGRGAAILYSENGDLKLRTSAGSTFTLPELDDAATIVEELNRERDYIRRIHEAAGHPSLEPLHAVWAALAERDALKAENEALTRRVERASETLQHDTDDWGKCLAGCHACAFLAEVK